MLFNKEGSFELGKRVSITTSRTVEMTFREFFELYKRDKKPRIRENTWRTKEAIVTTKIMPYLGDLLMNEISNVAIIQWQNELMKIKDDRGQTYSPTYLRTIHAQLSSILNHVCRYYNLKTNVARDVGTMGKKEADEMLFWTQEEYETFIIAVKDKPQSYYAFEILYWCGLRMGELLALTKEKFDFKRHTLKIDEFLNDEIKEYIESFYKLKPKDLIFNFSKSYLHHEMDRGSKKSQVKRIRIHDLRHSHVSLLIELGFSATAIADRVGHESIDITYRYAHLFPSKQKEMADSLTQVRVKTQNDWEDLLKEDEENV